MYIAVVDADPGNPDILHQKLIQAGYSVVTWSAYLNDVDRQRTLATSGKVLLINTLALPSSQHRPMWTVLRTELAEHSRPIIFCVPSRDYIARHLAELHNAGCLVLSSPLQFETLLDLLKLLEETAQEGKTTTHPTTPASSSKAATRQPRFLLSNLPVVKGIVYLTRSAQQWYRTTKPKPQ